MVLPHQREESHQRNPRELGGFPITQAPGADLFKEPEETHLLRDLLWFPGTVLKGLIWKVHPYGPCLRRSLSHEESIAGAAPLRTPDICPPTRRTPVNLPDSRTPVLSPN